MDSIAGYGSDDDSISELVELHSKPQAPSSSANAVYPVNAAASSSRSYFIPQMPNNSSKNDSSAVIFQREKIKLSIR